MMNTLIKSGHKDTSCKNASNNTKLTTEENVTFFKNNGYVILENAIPIEFILKLQNKLLELMNEKVERFNIKAIVEREIIFKENKEVKIDFKPAGGNHDINRWNMHLPSTVDFLNNQLLANDHVLPIIKSLLGDKPIAFILASDTPYPGSGLQNIHQDFPRFGLTVNIPLVDFTLENAPLEVWPGTHLHHSEGKNEFHTKKVDLSKDEINEMTNRVTSKKCLIKMGSILIRDQRLLHRGTRNLGNFPRLCLSLWYKNREEINPLALSIPAPNRKLVNYLSKVSKNIREDARGNDGCVKNRKLLNLGNLFGRVIEETAASDRDYRREIPKEVWRNLSTEAKGLLRFASIEKGVEDANLISKRSVFWSFVMALTGFSFYCIAQFIKVKSYFESVVKKEGKKRTPQKSNYRPIFILAALVIIGVGLPMLLLKKTLTETKPVAQLKSVIALSNIKVLEVVGNVYKIKGQKNEKILAGSQIEIGDQLFTENNSFAKLQTSVKSLIVMNENTQMKWNADNITLMNGDIYAEINKKDIPSVYRLKTPNNNSIHITGTAFEWSFQPNNALAVLKVKEGVVEFIKGEDIKIVKKSEFLNSQIFNDGSKPIKEIEVAPWLNSIKSFADNEVLLVDNFSGNEFNSNWVVTSTHDKDKSSPKVGIHCFGKNQKTEISTRYFDLAQGNPLKICFESESINAIGGLEFGWEVWNEKEKIMKQSYDIEQIDASHYRERELILGKPTTAWRNKTKAEKLPQCSFEISLEPNEVAVATQPKISYKENNAMADIELISKLQKVKLVFYVKTKIPNSEARWKFKRIAIGTNEKSTLKAFEEMLNK